MSKRPIGAVVQRAMIRKSMSTGELASEVGAREDVLTKFFYGQRAIDTIILEKIMNRLDLTLADRAEVAPAGTAGTPSNSSGEAGSGGGGESAPAPESPSGEAPPAE